MAPTPSQAPTWLQMLALLKRPEVGGNEEPKPNSDG